MRIGVKQFITRVTREVVNPDSEPCALSLARRRTLALLKQADHEQRLGFRWYEA